MLIFKRQQELIQHLSNHHSGNRIGFVPTMGALHQGHLSLIAASKNKCAVTVSSIFVNPKQFNDQSDLDRYPRTLSVDIEMLASAGCDILYAPTPEDIYIDEVNYYFDLKGLDNLWEGASRKGHFAGVINVCKRLFDIVKPSDVFFGQKDYQQCAIIRKMIRFYQMPIDFHSCPILREADQLAMSSRNRRLSAEERMHASRIPFIMSQALEKVSLLSPEKLSVWLSDELNASNGIQVDYALIADAADLKPAIDWNWPTVMLVACAVGPIRLLDNILIDSK